jgi:hypothetical protein
MHTRYLVRRWGIQCETQRWHLVTDSTRSNTSRSIIGTTEKGILCE